MALLHCDEALSLQLSTRPQRLDVCSLASHCRTRRFRRQATKRGTTEQQQQIMSKLGPMVFPLFLTATAYLSCTFRGCSPDCLVNVVATNAQISSILVLHDIVGSTCDSGPRSLASSSVKFSPVFLIFARLIQDLYV